MSRIIIILFIILFPALSSASDGAGQGIKMDFSRAGVERGRALFFAYCKSCHGLKYLKDKEHLEGYPPQLDPKAAEATFGVAPPDLSLMASARGKGTSGAIYIQRLLTTYYTDQKGLVKNKAFAEETQGDGTIAMPQPIPDSPELGQQAMDIGAYLYKVSEPNLEERLSLGQYVIIYLIILTVLLFALNKVVWTGVKKGKS